MCQYQVGEQNQHAAGHYRVGRCLAHFDGATFHRIAEEGRYAGNDEGKEQRLDDAAPDEPFHKHILQTVFQICGCHDTAEPAGSEGTDDTGKDAEYHQQRNHGDHGRYFGQNQVAGRIDTHNLQGVNLLGDAHGAQLRGNVRAYLACQNEAHDGRRELQQQDFAGHVAHGPARHPRTFDVQFDLDGDDGADEERYQQHDADGVHAELLYFAEVLAEEHTHAFGRENVRPISMKYLPTVLSALIIFSQVFVCKCTALSFILLHLRQINASMEDKKMVLRTEDLVKKYGKRTVVSHVSFDVKQGEIVGLLGPNGAGKTTSFYMTVGLITPNEGRIFLDDLDITNYPVYKRAQTGIGYLAQEASVFRQMSVEDNIASVLEMTNKPLDYQKDKLESLIAEFRLQKVRKNKGNQLSGGERRRTEIARCLAIDPKFIMLDEPFAGVDPIAVEDIQQIVWKLKDKNIGILITDHNVQETLSITSRAYLLFEGKILFQGTPEELAENQIVREKYLSNSFVLRRKDFMV